MNIKKNKKMVRNTLYDIVILSIISVICMLILHIGLKALLHIDTKTITDVNKAILSTKRNLMYISIMFISMFIISFIAYVITTADQVKDKTINKNNYKLFTIFMIGFILFVNTFLSFIASLIINARLTKLCDVCQTIDLSFYTYQLQQFISTIKLLCCSYVLWSIISIITVLVILRNSQYDNSIISKLKKYFKKIKVSRKSKVRKK